MTDFKLECRDWEVRAFLDGRKHQLRKPAWRPVPAKGAHIVQESHVPGRYHECPTIWQSVKPGDRLWVRETWSPYWHDTPIAYRADVSELRQNTKVWRPSIHMPREFSRITLMVEATKRERVQEISEADARAEGVEHGNRAGIDVDINGEVWNGAYRDAYAALWQSLHTKPGTRWEDNPEVVASTFRPILANINALEEAA